MMARTCGSCGGGRTVVGRTGGTTQTRPVSRNASAAGTDVEYEVLSARGTLVRRYATLVAATSHARRIGGSTRPAK